MWIVWLTSDMQEGDSSSRGAGSNIKKIVDQCVPLQCSRLKVYMILGMPEVWSSSSRLILVTVTSNSFILIYFYYNFSFFF